MNMTVDIISRALANELVVVLGGLVGAEAKAVPGAPVGSRQWIVECAIGGEVTGTCTMAFDAAPMTALAGVIIGVDGDVADSVVADTLREATNQAISAVSLDAETKAIRIAVVNVAVQDAVPAGRCVLAYIVSITSVAAPIALAVYGATAALAPAVETLRDEPSTSASSRIEVILDIDLPVVVRFGRTEMSIKALTRLGPGSVIDLGRSPDDPVEILVSDRVVAHGEVVVVGGNYGIRILDVASPAERMRTVEAWT
jgi:flagellar motor switch protein FliN/FliY